MMTLNDARHQPSGQHQTPPSSSADYSPLQWPSISLASIGPHAMPGTTPGHVPAVPAPVLHEGSTDRWTSSGILLHLASQPLQYLGLSKHTERSSPHRHHHLARPQFSGDTMDWSLTCLVTCLLPELLSHLSAVLIKCNYIIYIIYPTNLFCLTTVTERSTVRALPSPGDPDA